MGERYMTYLIPKENLHICYVEQWHLPNQLQIPNKWPIRPFLFHGCHLGVVVDRRLVRRRLISARISASPLVEIRHCDFSCCNLSFFQIKHTLYKYASHWSEECCAGTCAANPLQVLGAKKNRKQKESYAPHSLSITSPLLEAMS